MKKIYCISTLTLALSAALVSCDMDAPNQSSAGTDVIGYTEKLAESAVMSIHQSFGETNSYRGRFTPYYGLNTDVEIINGLAAVNYSADSIMRIACINRKLASVKQHVLSVRKIHR